MPALSRMASSDDVVQISSDGSDSHHLVCEDCQMEEDLGCKLKGPKYAKEDSYDDYCVYPNRVALWDDQEVILENICEEHTPRIPLYVCTVRSAMVADRGRGKMYFNKEFTSTYLKEYLTRSRYLMKVYYKKRKKMKEVRFKLDKAKKQAILTSDWMVVVDAEEYGEGDVLMFWFRRDVGGKLKLLVDRIMPGAFGLGTDKHLLLLDEALGQ